MSEEYEVLIGAEIFNRTRRGEWRNHSLRFKVQAESLEDAAEKLRVIMETQPPVSITKELDISGFKFIVFLILCYILVALQQSVPATMLFIYSLTHLYRWVRNRSRNQ